MRKVSLILGVIVCIIYLLNPTIGIFEILPDQLPIVGNLDEVGVTILLIRLLKELGIGDDKKDH